MARIRDVIQRSTRALQPAATAVDVGTLYYVTDESTTERSNGTVWQTYADAETAYQISFTLRAAVYPTGVIGFLSVPRTGTITKVRVLVIPATSSVVLDIWKDTYANYPPTVADTITAAAKPTISGADKYEDSTLTGWTTALTAGDVLVFNTDSVLSVTNLVVELSVSVP